jgi:hypothetical protein
MHESAKKSSTLAREKKLLEGPTKFKVEDGVDERIEEAVDVAKPDKEREQDGVDLTESGQLEEIVADTDGVDDVYGEEREPT